MLFIDDREPRDIVKALSQYDIPVTVTRLEFGDCMFEGCGEHGTALIGIERKRLHDLVTSMHDRRLSGQQLRGMLEVYDYLEVVVEGLWRCGSQGQIEELAGEWRTAYGGGTANAYRQLDAYLATLHYRAGVAVWRTMSVIETAAHYAARWHWFQKPWDRHEAHQEAYVKRTGPYCKGAPIPGMVWRVAAQLPGLDKLGQRIAGHFRSVEEMVLADEAGWRQIKGIGKVRARMAIEAIKR